MEDETGLYETVIFPQVYEQYSKLLFDQQLLLAYEQVVIDEGALSVEISGSRYWENKKRGKV